MKVGITIWNNWETFFSLSSWWVCFGGMLGDGGGWKDWREKGGEGSILLPPSTPSRPYVGPCGGVREPGGFGTGDKPRNQPRGGGGNPGKLSGAGGRHAGACVGLRVMRVCVPIRGWGGPQTTEVSVPVL